MLVTDMIKTRIIALVCLILWSPLLAPKANSQSCLGEGASSIYFQEGKTDYGPSYQDKGKRLEAALPQSQAVPAQDDAVSAVNSAQRKFFIGLQTNLLYDIASVLNLSLNVGFAKHYSIELLTTFSPWNYGKETVKFRTLCVQPEFRYWFTEGWSSHFIGLHTHVGWYNIAFGGNTRYQDRDGKFPLMGVGLSYGYNIPFSKHWGAEFTVGLGYTYLSYDKFYNIHNGVRFATEEKHYFGLTKLGASIYYRF